MSSSGVKMMILEAGKDCELVAIVFDLVHVAGASLIEKIGVL